METDTGDKANDKWKKEKRNIQTKIQGRPHKLACTVKRVKSCTIRKKVQIYLRRYTIDLDIPFFVKFIQS